jgi:hypothetical protein
VLVEEVGGKVVLVVEMLAAEVAAPDVMLVVHVAVYVVHGSILQQTKQHWQLS